MAQLTLSQRESSIAHGGLARTAVPAAGAAVAIALGGFMLGYFSMRNAGSPVVSAHPEEMGFVTALGGVLAHNVPTTLLLISGVLTAGLTAAFGSFLTWVFIGATFASSVAALGLGTVATTIWPYVPLEFAGFLGAALAGMYPVSCAIRARMSGDRTVRRAYRDALPATFRFAMLAILLICGGAVIEAFIMVGR